jgi:hypothetical protein
MPNDASKVLFREKVKGRLPQKQKGYTKLQEIDKE